MEVAISLIIWTRRPGMVVLWQDPHTVPYTQQLTSAPPLEMGKDARLYR